MDQDQSVDETRKGRYKLDCVFISRLWVCLKILFPSLCSSSLIMFILLLIISLGQQIVIYHVGVLSSQFVKVLGGKDTFMFRALLINSGCLIIAISLYNSIISYITGYLYISWRSRFCQYLHKHYMFKSTFYHINVLMQSEIDNADQRITQDADRFCHEVSNALPTLIISPFTIAYYSVLCFRATGYVGPTAIYVYFILGTIANRLVMGPIVNLVVHQEHCEGDFRYKHMEIRTFAESIAFMCSGVLECRKLSNYLKRLISVQGKLIQREFLLNFITNIYDYIGSILSYIVISVPIFAGHYDDMAPQELSALIVKNGFVSIYLVGCFSQLVNLSSKFADIFGYAHRLGELVENFEHCDQKLRKENNFFVSQTSDFEPVFTLTDVSLKAPDSDLYLVENLNMLLSRGENVFIVGSTGSGKSSLLRALANLWHPTEGSIRCSLSFDPSNLLFLPQKVYMTTGNLIEQVIYPLSLEMVSEDQKVLCDAVKQALQSVGLDYLIDRLGGLHVEPKWKWSTKLSPGEMQRLAFARLFYHRPKIAVLDEATSALGITEEDCFYSYCNHLDITLISVGHHEALRQYHSATLKLNDDSTWSYACDRSL